MFSFACFNDPIKYFLLKIFNNRLIRVITVETLKSIRVVETLSLSREVNALFWVLRNLFITRKNLSLTLTICINQLVDVWEFGILNISWGRALRSGAGVGSEPFKQSWCSCHVVENVVEAKSVNSGKIEALYK